ncbi:MAG: hypothetical protein M1814_001305 [Vezdaea aestivalis]|nr:MAG: hypothetical protein M1814_001305 [Vezdaea aestivalis]
MLFAQIETQKYVAARTLSMAKENVLRVMQGLPLGDVVPDITYFDSLPASDNLDYVSCYGGGFQCAKLNVPLDYDKPNVKKVALAIVKRPAGVSTTDPSYTDSLFVAVGTGVSATNFVLSFGPAFQGTDPQPKFDVIRWDIRGIGQTTPSISAFPDEGARANYFNNPPNYTKVPADGFASRSADLIPYYTTPNNARDLRSIVQKSGRKKFDSFVGYSYATVLGATYASLFPDDFTGMVLDGFVNSENHYGPTDNGYTSVRDAERRFQFFFESCSAGGAEHCPFWKATAAEVRKRYAALEEALRKKPVAPSSGRPFDYSALHDVVTLALLNPRDFFGFAAGVMAEAESGQAGPLIGFALGPIPPYEYPGYEIPPEFTQLIQCVDSQPFTVKDPKSDLEPFLKRMLRISPAIGADVAQARLACDRNLENPSGQTLPRGGAFDKRTAATIVFIGNTADPLTPLEK